MWELALHDFGDPGERAGLCIRKTDLADNISCAINREARLNVCASVFVCVQRDFQFVA